MAADKQHAHELIDQLPPSRVPAAINMLQNLLDPVAQVIANAPVDDECPSPQDEKSLAEASEWSKHNRATPHEEFLTELGITQEELDNYRQPK